MGSQPLFANIYYRSNPLEQGVYVPLRQHSADGYGVIACAAGDRCNARSRHGGGGRGISEIENRHSGFSRKSTGCPARDPRRRPNKARTQVVSISLGTLVETG